MNLPLPWEVLDVWNRLQELEHTIRFDWDVFGAMDDDLVLEYVQLEEKYNAMKEGR